MKGILKKGLAVLKRGVLLLPGALFVSSLAVGITYNVINKNKIDEFYDDFSKSEVVLEMKEEDYTFFEKQQENGLISNSELAAKKKHIDSREYLEELLILPENTEQQAMLKSIENKYGLVSKASLYTALGLFGAGLCFMITWAFNDDLSYAVGEFWDSAADDWNWAAENPKPKKGQKKVKNDSVEIEY